MPPNFFFFDRLPDSRKVIRYVCIHVNGLACSIAVYLSFCIFNNLVIRIARLTVLTRVWQHGAPHQCCNLKFTFMLQCSIIQILSIDGIQLKTLEHIDVVKMFQTRDKVSLVILPTLYKSVSWMYLYDNIIVFYHYILHSDKLFSLLSGI